MDERMQRLFKDLLVPRYDSAYATIGQMPTVGHEDTNILRNFFGLSEDAPSEEVMTHANELSKRMKSSPEMSQLIAEQDGKAYVILIGLTSKTTRQIDEM